MSSFSNLIEQIKTSDSISTGLDLLFDNIEAQLGEVAEPRVADFLSAFKADRNQLRETLLNVDPDEEELDDEAGEGGVDFDGGDDDDDAGHGADNLDGGDDDEDW